MNRQVLPSFVGAAGALGGDKRMCGWVGQLSMASQHCCRRMHFRDHSMVVVGSFEAVVQIALSVMTDNRANVTLHYIVSFIIANLRSWLANMLINHQMSLTAKACPRDFQRLCTTTSDMHDGFRHYFSQAQTNLHSPLPQHMSAICPTTW